MDYLHQRLPSTRDEEISALIAPILGGSPYSHLRERISAEHSDVLCVFGERMASLAVREEDANRLDIGLVALVLAGLDRGDREAILILPLHCKSAEKLGLSPVDIFERAAQVVGEPAAGQLRAFVKRPEVDRNLASMGYRETENDDGPVYERTW